MPKTLCASTFGRSLNLMKRAPKLSLCLENPRSAEIHPDRDHYRMRRQMSLLSAAQDRPQTGDHAGRNVAEDHRRHAGTRHNLQAVSLERGPHRQEAPRHRFIYKRRSNGPRGTQHERQPPHGENEP